MFALVLEKPPMELRDVPSAFQTWVLIVGAVAGLGLLIWALAWLLRRTVERRSHAERRPVSRSDAAGFRRWVVGSVVGGAVVSALALGMPPVWERAGWGAPTAQAGEARTGGVLLALGYFVAGFLLTGVLLPVFANLRRLSGRRIWALARLSIKEAVRSRTLWGFSFVLLVFLFASWFIHVKAEHQVSTYVGVVFFVMTVLMLLIAGLLSSLSIPADLKRQTIHTIVTKPVERYEIVIGRCLGYMILMTVVLVVMTGLSLLYVFREVDEEAKEESLKARVPVYGELQVIGGKHVGREWGYRIYIDGGVTEDRAIWTFKNLPRGLQGRDAVRCEFTFDVFRTTKGEEGKGVYANFDFQNDRWDAGKLDEFEDAWEKGRQEGKPDSVLDNELAQKYGFYRARSVKIEDYHTLGISVPGALFADAGKAPAGKEARPPLKVTVHFLNAAQYLGVAQADLYLLEREGGRAGFVWNFFKGATGIWFRLCLVIVVAVTCSTYLSGVISFLLTMLLFTGGLFLPYIREIASREEAMFFGGGPLQALIRLGQNVPMAQQLDRTPIVRVAEVMDVAFSFFLRPFLNIFPDVSRFSLTDYVADGFSIPAGVLVFDNFLPLVGYLVPWAVLAFYLVKSREVAA